MAKYVLSAPVLALAATAAPAQAQDFDWTGFYVGAHGAVVDTDADWTGESIYQTVDGGEGGFTIGSASASIADKLSGSEFGGGGRVGFNWQAGSFVLGAEADATFFGFTEGATHTSGGTTYTLVSDASDLETIRARAGVAMGRTLLFVTGGVAFSGLDHSLAATNVSEIVIDGGEGGDTIGTQTANLVDTASSGTGWTIGGGAEVAVSDKLSVALTVLHVDFGKETLGDSAPLTSITTTVDSKMLIGMFGVNLRF